MSISKAINKIKKIETSEDEPHKLKFDGVPCAYFDGMYQYFNIHYEEYHAKERAGFKNKWDGPCVIILDI
jgi:hypothetical protein